MSASPAVYLRDHYVQNRDVFVGTVGSESKYTHYKVVRSTLDEVNKFPIDYRACV